jgi:D-alanyl-lipoteichoic acid acyltransferase DltB (MBOAT superfamily)
VLVFFKYYNFFVENINDFLHISNASFNVPLLNIILPIGLSFHTFQAMSYTIEIYRGHQKAERHFGIYSLYVMFYPQLVAGPIERPQNLIHQFHEKHKFDYDNVVSGLRQMMWGMFKKVVVADRLAAIADPMFNNPTHYSGIALAIASVFFAFQIFCDFSGYSDIAIGAARVMGFHLMTNFNKPYHSKSIAEFWKRWHISLSTWFKDYLYISLGGNRVSKQRVYFNLFFVFLVSGFWHGANWTFLLWGAINGFYLIFALLTNDVRHKMMMATGIGKVRWLSNFVNIATTFALATLAWIFFRAKNAGDAFYIVKKVLNIPSELGHVLATHKIAFLNLPALYIIRNGFLVIIALELLYYIADKFDFKNGFAQKPAYVRWAIYYAAPLIIYWFGIFEKHEFIYFKF